MKVSYIAAILMIVFNFYSCKDDKNTSQTPSGQEEIKQDSASLAVTDKVNEISLDAVKSEVPEFTNPEVKQFVAKTKTYFEQVAEATRKGETDKVLELQFQAADIDTEFQKVKGKLSGEQQKQLSDWYMKLVEAASK